MSSYKQPKRIQTIEKHDQIYYDYLELNQMLKLEVPQHWRDVTQTWKYKSIAEKHYLNYKTVQRVVIGKLREKAPNK